MTGMEPQWGTICSCSSAKLIDSNFPSLNKKLCVHSAASGSKRSPDGDQDDSNKVCWSFNFLYKYVVDECNVFCHCYVSNLEHLRNE